MTTPTPLPPLPDRNDLIAAIQQLRKALDFAEGRAAHAEQAAKGSAIMAEAWRVKARKWRRRARRAEAAPTTTKDGS